MDIRKIIGSGGAAGGTETSFARKCLIIFELPLKAMVTGFILTLVIGLRDFFGFILILPYRVALAAVTSARKAGLAIPLRFMIATSVISYLSLRTGLFFDKISAYPAPTIFVNTVASLIEKIDNIDFSAVSQVSNPVTAVIITYTELLILETSSAALLFLFGPCSNGIIFIITLVLLFVCGAVYISKSKYYNKEWYFMSSMTNWFVYGIKEPFKKLVTDIILMACCIVYFLIPGINIILYLTMRRHMPSMAIPLWCFGDTKPMPDYRTR